MGLMFQDPCATPQMALSRWSAFLPCRRYPSREQISGVEAFKHFLRAPADRPATRAECMAPFPTGRRRGTADASCPREVDQNRFRIPATDEYYPQIKVVRPIQMLAQAQPGPAPAPEACDTDYIRILCDADALDGPADMLPGQGPHPACWPANQARPDRPIERAPAS